MSEVTLNGENVDFQGPAPATAVELWSLLEQFLGQSGLLLDRMRVDDEDWAPAGESDSRAYRKIEAFSISREGKVAQIVAELLGQQPLQKRIDDPIDILVLEDKPAIIAQIENGFAKTPWNIHGVGSTGEAIDFCQRKVPDCIIISLSVPDDAAITLFRIIRSNAKTKYVPLFGLSVKTELDEQQRAQQAGFSTIITKPIDFGELENKIGKAVNLDASGKYFAIDEAFMTVKLPSTCNATVVNEVSNYLKTKTSEAVDAGIAKVIFDTQEMQTLNTEVVKLLLQSMQLCRDLSLNYALAGNSKVVSESKKFEESKDWNFCDSVEAARSSL